MNISRLVKSSQISLARFIRQLCGRAGLIIVLCLHVTPQLVFYTQLLRCFLYIKYPSLTCPGMHFYHTLHLGVCVSLMYEHKIFTYPSLIHHLYQVSVLSSTAVHNNTTINIAHHLAVCASLFLVLGSMVMQWLLPRNMLSMPGSGWPADHGTAT